MKSPEDKGETETQEVEYRSQKQVAMSVMPVITLFRAWLPLIAQRGSADPVLRSTA